MGDVVLERLDNDDDNEQQLADHDADREQKLDDAPTLNNFVRKAARRLYEPTESPAAKGTRAATGDATAATGSAAEKGEKTRRAAPAGYPAWLKKLLIADAAEAAGEDVIFTRADARTSAAPEKESAQPPATKRRRHTDYGS